MQSVTALRFQGKWRLMCKRLAQLFWYARCPRYAETARRKNSLSVTLACPTLRRIVRGRLVGWVDDLMLANVDFSNLSLKLHSLSLYLGRIQFYHRKIAYSNVPWSKQHSPAVFPASLPSVVVFLRLNDTGATRIMSLHAGSTWRCLEQHPYKVLLRNEKL